MINPPFDLAQTLNNQSPDFHLELDSDDPSLHNFECSYTTESNIISDSKLDTSNNIFFSHLNIRSLSKNFDQLHNLVNELRFNSAVIAISETWLKDVPSSLFSIERFTLLTNNRTKKRGGGVGLYVTDNLESSMIDELSVMSDELESIFIEITVPGTQNIVVGEIYRPPNSNPTNFIVTLQNLLSAPSLINKRTFIMGDFNLNLLHYNENANCHEFLDLMLSHSFVPLTKKPTRVTDSTSTLIDNIFVNNLTNITTGIIVSDISDHYPIHALLSDFRINSRGKFSSSIRDFSDSNLNKLRERLSSLDWSSVYNTENVSASFKKFIDTFNLHFNQIIPSQNPSRSNYRKIPRAPWISKAILRSINRKNSFFHRYKLNPTQETKRKYTRYRNTLTNVLRMAKKNYFAKQFELYKHDAKSTWKVINKVINPKRSHEPIKRVRIDDAHIQEPCEIAEAFNDFFVEIGPTLANKIPKPVKPFNHYLKERNSSSFFFVPVVEEEVQNIIIDLNTKKASGYDELNNFLLKNTVNEIISPLTHILNMSLMQGVVPDRMKIAKVIPVFKKGNSEDLSNYRPISLLTSVSKILERLVYSRTLKFLNEFNVLSNSQFGFRKKHSTSHALLTFIDKIANATDNQLHTVGIFLDLSKAFDTIDHDILLYKLCHYGIRGKALDWFKSYLSNRKQFVTINGQDSSLKNISCGVPQGSLLGPLLFIIYINDLPNSSDVLSFILFADDSNIFYSHRDPQFLLNKVNNEIKFVQDWIYANKLSLNINKTHYMVFSNTVNSLPGHILINNVTLQQIECTKFLGLYIDDDLSWKSHISYLCKLLSRNTGVLYRLKEIFPIPILQTVYATLITSYMFYGILAWGNSASFLLNKILHIQKRAIRIVNHKHFLAHTNMLFFTNNVLKITDLFLYNVGIFMYKLSTKDLPDVFLPMFRRNNEIHTYPTRQRQSFHLPRTRTVFAQKTITYNGPRFWNDLPNELIVSPSFRIFKRKLKTFLLGRYK